MAGSSADRVFLDARRWYTFGDAYATRAEALTLARAYRRSDAFGPGRAFRVVRSEHTGRWYAQHAAGITADDRARGAYYNRRMLREASDQMRAFPLA